MLSMVCMCVGGGGGGGGGGDIMDNVHLHILSMITRK